MSCKGRWPYNRHGNKIMSKNENLFVRIDE